MTLRTYVLVLALSIGITFQAQEMDGAKVDSLKSLGLLTEVIEYFETECSSDRLEDHEALELAACYAMLDKNDEAFALLDDLLDRSPDYSDLPAIIEANLYYLIGDVKWNDIFERIVSNYHISKGQDVQDKEYARILYELAAIDQSFYYQVHMSEGIHGRDSPLTKAIWETKSLLNSNSMEILDSLILSNGWPTISRVGGLAASKAFFVVQHSDLSSQLRYLPKFEEAYANGEAQFNWVAMLTDRVLFRQELPQMYGSQGAWDPQLGMYVVYELAEPDSVNIWRDRYDLGAPISKKGIEDMYNPHTTGQ